MSAGKFTSDTDALSERALIRRASVLLQGIKLISVWVMAVLMAAAITACASPNNQEKNVSSAGSPSSDISFASDGRQNEADEMVKLRFKVVADIPEVPLDAVSISVAGANPNSKMIYDVYQVTPNKANVCYYPAGTYTISADPSSITYNDQVYSLNSTTIDLSPENNEMVELVLMPDNEATQQIAVQAQSRLDSQAQAEADMRAGAAAQAQADAERRAQEEAQAQADAQAQAEAEAQAQAQAQAQQAQNNDQTSAPNGSTDQSQAPNNAPDQSQSQNNAADQAQNSTNDQSQSGNGAFPQADQAAIDTAREEAQQIIDASPGQNLVVLPDDGDCYHNNSCRTLQTYREVVTIEEAQRRGYKACGICNP